MVSLFGTFFVSAASAETNLAISRFDPTPAADHFFGVDQAQVDGHLALDVRLTVDWAHDPLVFHAVSDNRTLVAVVANQVIGDLGISLALWNRLQLSIDVPLAVFQSGPSPAFGAFSLASPSGVHIGDARIGARVRFLTTSRGLFNLSFGAFMWLPIGSSTSAGGVFASDGMVRGRVELLAGGERGRFLWATGVGGDLRREQTFLEVTQGSMLRVTAAAAVLLLSRKQLQIGPEVSLDLTPPKITRYNTNLELLGGVRYQFFNRIAIGAAAGPGLTSGIGTPDFRVVGTLGWGHEFREPPPQEAPAPLPPPPEPLPPPPPPDRDGDGIIDALDACPDVPGVISDDAKKNGCPPDRDGDGIADAHDACPDVGGVASDDPSKNGCPPDRDGDGIVDAQDACPDEKGGPSPDPKQNGCPSGAVVGHQIVMLDPIRFKSGSDKILPKSDEILKTVRATILTLAPDTRFIIEGHTDNRGKPAANRKLSLARAKSVVRWMVAHGLAEKRFDTRGFGPDKPLVGNDSDRGREINRRVEFHIAE